MSSSRLYPARRWRELGAILVLMSVCGLAVASQPTPPVTIEVSAADGKKPNEVIARVTLTANIEVSNATLVIHSQARELKIGEARRSLRLAPGKPVVVEVPIAVGAAGVHQFDIEVKANAKGFESAGGFERRYVSWDGKQPARILTGKEARREYRLEIDRKLQEMQRSNPDARVSIDNFLRQRLQELRETPKYDERAQQALAPPAAGIEPYEADVVVDKTADVIRELDPITVTGRLWFTDRAGSTRPLINATVDIRDSDTFGDEQLTSVVTGWDGRFTAVVNNDDGWFQNGRDIYIRVRASNSRFRVQDCAAWPDWTYAWDSEVHDDLSDGTVVNFGDRITSTNNEASILFQDLNQGWNFLTTSGGQDPGFIDLCWPEDASQYSTFWEEVDIEDGDEVARDIVLHEYGHGTMHNAYDGYWPDDTGGDHGFNDILHPNMAFTEGWGTFIALSINDDGVYNSTSFSRAIESFNHSSGHSNSDGQKNEGHVAAGMHDVRDRGADGSCAGGGNCDPSGANSATMSQIWRDSFWLSKADNIGEYWPRLCAELDAAQGTAAVNGLAFNAIDVNTCKCTVRQALAGNPNAEAEIRDLHTMRDRGLRNTDFGRRVIDLYYRHTAEVTGMLLKDAEMRRMAATLFSRAAEGSRVLLKEGERDGVLLDEKTARMARDFIARAQKSGSPQLRQDFNEVARLIDQLEGRSYEEIRGKFAAPGRKK